MRAVFKGGDARKLFHIVDESDVTFVGIDFEDGMSIGDATTGAGKGGAISVHDSKVTISSATFKGNEAKRRCPTEKSGYGASCNHGCYKHNSCSYDGWDYAAYGGALYLTDGAMVLLSAVQFESNNAQQGTDIWVSTDSTLTCTAGCTTRGMYMPSGTCTTPSTAASVHGGTCEAHCSTAESDCAVCGEYG